MYGNTPVMVKCEDGQLATPPFVILSVDGKRSVGSKAPQQATENPNRNVSSVKWLIGMRYSEMLRMFNDDF